MQHFIAKIYKLGINPVVDPPDEVLNAVFEDAGRSKGPIPVCGRLNGTEFIQTLVKYQGAWRLYINGQMLKDSGHKVGDKADVDIEYDPRRRDVAMPKALASALRKDEKAKAAFEVLSPSRRKEILRYLGSLKTTESLNRNIAKIVANIRGDNTGKQHVVLRGPKK